MNRIKKQIVACVTFGLFSISLLSAARAETLPPISPFGNLEWRDTMGQVMDKLRAFEGIQKVELSFGQRERVNLKGLKKGAVGKAIEKLFTKTNPLYLKATDPRLRHLVRESTDGNGNRRKVLPRDFLVHASPIIIAAVPFELTAKFEVALGLAVEKPDAVISVKGGVYHYPLILTKVELASTSPALKDHHKEIEQAIIRKYKKYDDASGKDLLRMMNTVVDKEKRTFRFWPLKRGRFSMRYESKIYQRELQEVFRKHRVKLESQKAGGARDQKSKL